MKDNLLDSYLRRLYPTGFKNIHSSTNLNTGAILVYCKDSEMHRYIRLGYIDNKKLILIFEFVDNE